MRSLNMFLLSVAALLLVFAVGLALIDHWANTAFTGPGYPGRTP